MPNRSLMLILWPAFLAAGVLEIMVFAVLDPHALTLLGEQVNWSREAIYSISFLIFWAVFAGCSAVTLVLARTPGDVNRNLPHPVADRD